MRIVLDLENLQEMSEYIAENSAAIIAKSIARIADNHEVIIILSAAFPNSINNIRIYFSDVLPSEKILVYYVPEDMEDKFNNNCRKIASVLKEAFIANLKPDIVHIFSYLGNEIGLATGAGLLPDNVLSSISIHESNSLPLHNKKDDENVLANYRKSDLIFTFDEEIIDHVIKLYGLNKNNIVNIGNIPLHEAAPKVIKIFEKKHITSDYEDVNIHRIIDEIGKYIDCEDNVLVLADIASCLSDNMSVLKKEKTLFVDVSSIVQNDLKTGIERVTRSILKQFIENPPEGYTVAPVYADANSIGYRYACNLHTKLTGKPSIFEDEPIDTSPYDIFLGLDWFPYMVECQMDFLKYMRNKGIKVYFIVHDILPLIMPDKFPQGTDEIFRKWLQNISQFDGVICDSSVIAEEVCRWQHENHIMVKPLYRRGYFYLSGDIGDSIPSKGLPKGSEEILQQIDSHISVLSVSTIEPRKGYDEAFEAFEKLWASGVDLLYVIVGRKGWMVENLCKKITTHKEFGKRLFWLQGISDEYLEKVYKASTVLLNPSLGEGFGLSIVEAARHRKPIIVRDIPIFREVAGEYAFYFNDDLDKSLRGWLELYQKNAHPKTEKMQLLPWKDSAEMLLKNII